MTSKRHPDPDAARDPGDAVPPGVPGAQVRNGDSFGETRRLPRHDPGDAVPPGVAPIEPVPLSQEEERMKAALERKLRPKPG